MSAACRKFLNDTQDSGHSFRNNSFFFSSLRELHALFGIHIAKICYAYDLEVQEYLIEMLPPEPDKEFNQ